MDLFLIKPLKEIVLHPLTRQALPKEGIESTLDAYWQRRIDAGDVQVTPLKKVTNKPPAKEGEIK